MKPKETIDYHIKHNWHAIVNLYNYIAQQYDLTQATGFALLNINANGTPATKIAPLMGMRPTSLVRLLDKMEKQELIFREKDKKDKRFVKIFLTDKGIEKQRISKKVVREFNEFIIDKIGKDKLHVYYEVMEDILQFTDTYHQNKLS